MSAIVVQVRMRAPAHSVGRQDLLPNLTDDIVNPYAPGVPAFSIAEPFNYLLCYFFGYIVVVV